MKLLSYLSINLAATSFCVLTSNDGVASASKLGTRLRGNTSSDRIQRVLEAEQVGLFLAAEFEYEDDAPSGGGPPANPDRPPTRFYVGLSDGFFEIVNAPPGWTAGLKPGESLLRIPPGLTKTGATVDMGGRRPENAGSKGPPRKLVDDASRTNERESDLARLRRDLAVVTGTKTMLVVRVEHTGPGNLGTTTSNQGTLANHVFGTAIGGDDAICLRSQFMECSKDQLDFQPTTPTTSANGAVTNIENGSVTVTVNTDCSTLPCDDVMRNDVNNLLASAFGVTVDTLDTVANHIMHCLPDGANDGIAYAYINSWNSVYSDRWCEYTSAQLHEIGHNLGLAHSSEGWGDESSQKYGDQTGAMGYSYSNLNQQFCFNNAKSYQLNWFAGGEVEMGYNSVWSGNLVGQINFDLNNPQPVVIKVSQPPPTNPPSLADVGNNGSPAAAFPLGECEGDCDGDSECADGLECFQRSGTEPVPGCTGLGQSAKDYCYNPDVVAAYYIGFNHEAKYNVDTKEAGDLVTVQQYSGDGYAKSYLVGKISANSSWSRVLGPDTVTIDVGTIDTDPDNGYAQVTVTYGSPPVTPNPTKSPTAPGYCSDDAATQCWNVNECSCFDAGAEPAAAPGESHETTNLFDRRLTLFGRRLYDCSQHQNGGSCPKKANEPCDWVGGAGCVPKPTPSPTAAPSTGAPSPSPTDQPSKSPSSSPTGAPSTSPSKSPTASPVVSTSSPSKAPTTGPTASPSASPSSPPTKAPSHKPTTAPPTQKPSANPTDSPTASPTSNPVVVSTSSPSRSPSAGPTASPSASPSSSPSKSPSSSPTASPVVSTSSPSKSPSAGPTSSPSVSPSPSPSKSPSKAPSASPSKPLSSTPTSSPVTSTNSPSASPSRSPTKAPSPSPLNSTGSPTKAPSVCACLGLPPTNPPTASPTDMPSKAPTSKPTDSPTPQMLSLQDVGDNGSGPFPLGQCEGDCDDDTECGSGLLCFQRSGTVAVPGCSGLGTSSKDYCAVRPSPDFLFLRGNNGAPGIAFPLGACEGDCDGDSECDDHLICKLRSGDEPVPGCTGPGTAGEDYCHFPPLIMAGDDGSGPFPLGACEGDCDGDSECADGLLCMERSGNEPVPGCTGEGSVPSGKDFCYDPSYQ